VEFECKSSDGVIPAERRLGIVVRQQQQQQQQAEAGWVVEEAVAVPAAASPPPSPPSPSHFETRQRVVGEAAITFVWPRKHMGITYAYTVASLTTLEHHAQELVRKNQNQVPVVWGACVDRRIRAIHTHYLAEQIFGTDPKPHELYVAHLLLVDTSGPGKRYFQQTGMYTFVPKPLQQVEHEKKLQQAQQRDGPDTLLFLHRLQRRLRTVMAENGRRDGDVFLLPAIQAQLPSSVPPPPATTTTTTTAAAASAPAPAPAPAPVAATSHTTTATPPHSPVVVGSGSGSGSSDSAFIQQLKMYALATPHHPPSERVYARLLEPLRIGRRPEEVFHMLVRLGEMDTYTNPHLARFSHKLEMEPRDMQAFLVAARRWSEYLAPVLAIPTTNTTTTTTLPLPAWIDRDHTIRRDMRGGAVGAVVLSIDGSTASDEVDDAVSVMLHPEDNTMWLYVHIADPSRVIQPNDPLDMTVRQRAMSAFLPERVFTMFPSQLAREHFSLLPTKANFALTYAIRIDPSTGKVLGYDIVPSLIDPVVALSYDRADAILLDHHSGKVWTE
jgi:hypothetical protein